jgi:hypothetical protein
MSNITDSALKKVQEIFVATEEVLNTNQKMAVSELMKMVGDKLKLDSSNTKKIDPLVRFFVKEHPGFNIVPGVGGGVKPVNLAGPVQKMAARKINNELKEQLKNQIEAKFNKPVEEPVIENEISMDDDS